MKNFLEQYLLEVLSGLTISFLGVILIFGKRVWNFLKHLGVFANEREQLGIIKLNQGESSSDFLSLLESAQEELWLIHISGGDQIRRNSDDVINWCKKQTSRELRIMCVNPDNIELLKAIERKDDIEPYRTIIKETHRKFWEASEGKSYLSAEEGKKIKIKVYNFVPTASIVACDPKSKKVLLFVEFFLHFKPWKERLCLTMRSGGRLYKTYMDAFEQLWKTGEVYDWN
jgi:hypothetical protein